MTRTDTEGRRGGEAVPGAGGEVTVEAFVARLHDEGVEAGRQEAERVLWEARGKAGEIVDRARAEAEALVSAGEAKVAEETARGKAELRLAARDAVLELRAALTDTLSTILAGAVSRELADGAVVKRLLEEVVTAYARNDASRRPSEFLIPRTVEGDVVRWWRSELSDTLRGEASMEVNPVLEAGFEYRIDGGTVEVSVDATVAKLMELMRPRLREVVGDGAAGIGAGGGEAMAASGVGERGG